MPDPEIPDEYADTYAEAYRRALESGEYDELNTGIHPIVVDPGEADRLIPEVDPQGAGHGGSHRTGGNRAASGGAGGPDLRRWAGPAGIAIAAVLLIVIAYALGSLFSDDDPSAGNTADVPATVEPAPSDQPRPRPSKTPRDLPTTDAATYDGDVAPVVPERARASCRARNSTDSAGRTVRYVAGNTLDSDPATAWRCNGVATGETIRYFFGDGIEIGEVGLIPGYAKTDPADGTDRFEENNRITRVRWILADGVVVEQELDPSDRGMQTVRVPATGTDQITLEILGVTDGPRNTTMISDVAFAETDD